MVVWLCCEGRGMDKEKEPLKGSFSNLPMVPEQVDTQVVQNVARRFNYTVGVGVQLYAFSTAATPPVKNAMTIVTPNFFKSLTSNDVGNVEKRAAHETTPAIMNTFKKRLNDASICVIYLCCCCSYSDRCVIPEEENLIRILGLCFCRCRKLKGFAVILNLITLICKNCNYLVRD